MKNGVILETERLILRRYRESDLQDLYEYLSDPEVVEFEPYRPMVLEEVREELSEDFWYLENGNWVEVLK